LRTKLADFSFYPKIKKKFTKKNFSGPTYNGNRNCQERLKRGIVQARLMVRECMAELEKSRHQQNATNVGGSQ